MATATATPEVTTEPLLCWNWLCPYVQRVSLALAHKGAHPNEVAIDLRNKPDWLPRFSPLGKVPAVTYMEDGEQVVLYESLALIHWVDEYYKDGPPLMPESPAKRTLARIIIARFDGTAVPTMSKLLRAQTPEEFSELLKVWRTELTWLESKMDPKGPFFGGAKPSLVDVTVAPWLCRAFLWKHYKNVDVLAGHPKLSAWVEAYKALPEVVATYRPPAGSPSFEEAMLKGYAVYGGERRDFSAVAA
eukprot:CAMPEP_0119106720 /NCGR_PEP_ID=MMETSP1180-20130426/6283_1 /TAXON_ID=3052 ORGANISM="Chlamydomonas cf sp, Strain CCMP681" /NCGR_SAMPLE_ID=MMETSP1180 /ASSEMBLY_ACC=CAM_ASM_000741 /LENGTH=245 /DNA_ID=CAMNT_0007092101 /DNA_START=93 /DNA_END=830 /DNA_ORIENTATION=-